ncbi:MAG TPA: glycosyltransferase family 4 protein, partial [Acidimicrobiia bacterium]|nr:glycosyltransferase family 4 protein [Acidimicrobiia bacterium]
LKNKDTRLVIAGDGPLRTDLERRATIHGSKIIFTGWIDSPALVELLTAASIGLAPYRRIDGFGNKLSEYLAHGLPVITSAGVGGSEFIERNACGANYSRGDARSLADVLRIYLSDAALIAKQSKAAVAAHARNFSLESVASQFERVLQVAANR